MAEPDDETASGQAEITRGELASAAVRLALALGALVLVVALLSAHYRGPLERFGHAFVARFGVLGVAGGCFLADSVHFPVPPQFFLFAGEAGGMPASIAVSGALVGSCLGGLAAFAAARALAARRPLGPTPRTRTGRVLTRLFDRHGYLGVAIAGTLPVSYSVLCILAGAMRLPWRAYGVLAVMRVPRLLVSYAVIVLAWSPRG